MGKIIQPISPQMSCETEKLGLKSGGFSTAQIASTLWPD